MAAVDDLPRTHDRPPSMLRTVGFLAVFGFLALLLAGPVLGVVSALFALVCVVLSLVLSAFAVVLSFAIVGFILWVPIRMFWPGRTPPWEDIGCKGKSLCLSLVCLLKECVGAVWRAVQWSRPRAQQVWCGTVARARRQAWFLGKLLIEVASGSLLGGLVGLVIADSRGQKPITAVAVGAALGCLLGLFIAATRTRPEAHWVDDEDGVQMQAPPAW